MGEGAGSHLGLTVRIDLDPFLEAQGLRCGLHNLPTTHKGASM